MMRKKKPTVHRLLWDGMTVTEWEYASRYIRDAADIMALRDWIVKLSRTPADDLSCAAMNHTTYGRRRMLVSLGLGWGRYSASEKREYIAHELLHAHWEATFQMGLGDMQQYLGIAAYGLYRAAFMRQAELSLDSTAMLIAPTLPIYKL
jgi:hypothetical protein